MNTKVLGRWVAIAAWLCVGGLTVVNIWFIYTFQPSTMVVATCILAIIVNALVCGLAVWKREAVATSALAVPDNWRKPLLLVFAMSVIGSFFGGLSGNYALGFLSMLLIPAAFRYFQWKAVSEKRLSSGTDDADSP